MNDNAAAVCGAGVVPENTREPLPPNQYELDEDISVKSLLLGIGDRTQPARKAS